MQRDYLFVGIDDFSRELYAAIFPNKTQDSAASFLAQLIEECPYTVECAYSDNGTEYKGTPDHAFVALCKENGRDKSLRVYAGHRPMVRLNVCSKLLSRCGMSRQFFLHERIVKLDLLGL